jgi:hypothetical protein
MFQIVKSHSDSIAFSIPNNMQHTWLLRRRKGERYLHPSRSKSENLEEEKGEKKGKGGAQEFFKFPKSRKTSFPIGGIRQEIVSKL